MKYVSTRGKAPALTFKQALLVGLAEDGGLYVPESWPAFSAAEIAAFRGKPYADVAFAVMRKFIAGEIPDGDLRGMIDEAYATFHHAAVTPLVQTGANAWLLELFHGPTLAFKDVAMQILARLMDYVLQENNQTLTIVGATSGDTGGAALAAFAGRENINIFFMFPEGRVSPVQQRQMTTVNADNTHAFAIDGSFDDCQNMVKAMFSHHAFRDSVRLSAVNSINWGRIMAQVVYYFTAAASLGAPERAVSFTVPTGNFGDIYAGFVARQMGLPIEKLVIATNENDILCRAITDGRYEMRGVKATITPSMDIQISSNFERLLFEASGRDTKMVGALMAGLQQSGAYNLPEKVQRFISTQFAVGAANEAQTREMMRAMQAQNGYLPDPHTAVALHVAQNHLAGDAAMVTLSTAHPCKFPDTVKQATGINPALPEWARGLMDAKEVFARRPNDQGAVEACILEKTNQHHTPE